MKSSGSGTSSETPKNNLKKKSDKNVFQCNEALLLHRQEVHIFIYIVWKFHEDPLSGFAVAGDRSCFPLTIAQLHVSLLETRIPLRSKFNMDSRHLWCITKIVWKFH